ncbi:redox-sensing transcriptional repressor [Hydrogenispora ethanolica]|uniref:Redox-sensing transcriptional repressor Rex n=1 Tax=Hydrogenispora ethanolica TaxID=1082276 RepID=A0A4R1R1Q0_HYDET|nr:redox-sensing transcriptional repressor Rex [Hydrogenispora ethanolica]TCL59228.1 redox-sensing transcriptional repressor [Hydrogenispora ethanolica]
MIVPKFTLKRLPFYYRCLCGAAERGENYVSSEEIARAAQVNAVQVRRDLTVFGALGQAGLGYHVNSLKAKLEEILGLKNTNEAVLVGVGRLGRAIVDYTGFERYGLNIVALFDSAPELVGQRVSGREVFPVAELEHIVKRLGIKVGIITVPTDWAQPIAGIMVRAGIKAIWNFAPVSLETPPDVVVRNEDLAAGLATLFHFLAEKD